MFRMHSRANPLAVVAAIWLLCFPLAKAGAAPTASSAAGKTAEFTLKTGVDGGMHFVGVGGSIAGIRNPVLHVGQGQRVRITLIDGDGVEHDVSVPAFHALSKRIDVRGARTSIEFRAGKRGVFAYYCTVPGHRGAGMEGKIDVGGGSGSGSSSSVAAAGDPSVVRSPDDLPPPVGARGPEVVKVHMVTTEVEATLAPGVSYTYWTFNGKVPGPMIRTRVGDTVQLTLTNAPDSHMVHSIDLHAVIGPGGGSALLQVAPGESRTITFKVTRPGLFVYHCATPMVAEHIASGMFGMILVEPRGGLAAVDHEFYVMQSEFYTASDPGDPTHLGFDVAKLIAEQPTYVVFNGSADALKTAHPLRAGVGDTVRIFFGDAGPNLTSSFHVIGEIMDDVWAWGSLSNPPLHDIQTITVPPGGAVISQFRLHVPGRYILVDHALGRMEQGLAGFLEVSGAPEPGLYHRGPAR